MCKAKVPSYFVFVLALFILLRVTPSFSQTETATPAPPPATAAPAASVTAPTTATPVALPQPPQHKPGEQKQQGNYENPFKGMNLKATDADRAERPNYVFPSYATTISSPSPFKKLPEIIDEVDAYCKSYTQQYSDDVAKTDRIWNMGTYFTDVCLRFSAELKKVNKYDGNEELYSIPNPALLYILDGRRIEMRRSFAWESVVRINELNKSYDESPFGKIGIPMKNQFFISQILQLISTALLLVLTGLVVVLIRRR